MLRDQYKQARKNYNPKKHGKSIDILFIAESPPSSGDYFYFEKWCRGSNLFTHMMSVISPIMYEDERDKKPRDIRSKKQLLERFRDEKGYYLIDVCDKPIDKLNKKGKRREIEKNYKNKINEIKKLIGKNTKIVTIGKKAEEFLSRYDEDGKLPVIKHLPFPNYGGITKFKKRLGEVIKRKSNKFIQEN